MKIVGLITEYNPFHNGHLYHIEESLRITGADKVIVVMSGDFVQRGVPAIMPKHLRAAMALECSASLVIELPVRYATGSAEYFATGAVSLLHELGCVDAICFGSECGDLNLLSQIADVLLEEPSEYQSHLQALLRSGFSYPSARQQALEHYFNSDIHEVLADPNNILGVEYIKAIKKLNSRLIPYTITRKTSHYHDEDLQENCSSASAIRKQIHQIPVLETQVPKACYNTLLNHSNVRYPILTNDFSLLLHERLLTATSNTLLQYHDMTDELANRILNKRNQFLNIDQFCELLKTKNLTRSRINRALLHLLLQIPKYDTPSSSNWNHYIHILGFRKEDRTILTTIKENSTLPILTKLTDIDSLTSQGQQMITEDINASNLYESVVTNKFSTSFIHELEKSLILV